MVVKNIMEYRPALPEKNSNVSHEHPLKEFFLLFAGITLCLLSLFWAAGQFVDFAAEYISPQIEAKIFASFCPPKCTVGNTPEQALLQELTDHLVACAGISYPLDVFLVESDIANAIALPGGRIVVFKGLLSKVKSENGLCFVLAHELGHFKNRDHLKGMGRSLVMTAAAAILTGAGSDITRLVAPTVDLNMAFYSRDRENLADLSALETLNCYYGHVGGADEFFTAMAPEQGSTLKGVTHYFDSHPEAMERIKSLRKAAAENNYKTGPVRPLPQVFIFPAVSEKE